MATAHAAPSKYTGDRGRGPDILGAILSTYCISVIVLSLRIAARKVSKAGFWVDDWLIFASMVDVSVYMHSMSFADSEHRSCIPQS